MNIKDVLAEKIAGEITLSPKSGETIRKWRNAFDITQTEIATHLHLSPSVISDYESGRRQSPGIKTIKKIIDALIEIDETKNNSKILKQYQFIIQSRDGILDLHEYPYSISINTFTKAIDGKILTPTSMGLRKQIKGFTLIDGVETIKKINSTGYQNLYGWNTERALIFTGIRYGRSPMIAIRIHPVKPSVVVYHNPSAVDSLAIQLAERENIPLIITNITLDDLQERLLKLGR